MTGYTVMEATRKTRRPVDDKTRAMFFGQTAAMVTAATVTTATLRVHE